MTRKDKTKNTSSKKMHEIGEGEDGTLVQKYSKQAQRIHENSCRFIDALDAVNNLQMALDTFEQQWDNIVMLDEYLQTDFRKDYEADERGKIDHSVRRDILGQDTLYDFLMDLRDLRDRMEEVVSHMNI